MSTVHAWFSISAALRIGSTPYRKLSGSTVNVTRTDADKDAKGKHEYDERYVGEVIQDADGGRMGPMVRVPSITG